MFCPICLWLSTFFLSLLWFLWGAGSVSSGFGFARAQPF